MFFAANTSTRNDIERLYGIMSGISINCHINDREILELRKWKESRPNLKDYEPYKGLNSILDDILADGIIDEGEREDLLEWCSDTINGRGFLQGITEVSRQLHGILEGIACDEIIKPNELEGLKDWLLDYEYLHNWWPINELFALIKQVLKDGKIDSKEQVALQKSFNDYREYLIEKPQIHDDEYWTNRHMMSNRPVFKPIQSICVKNPEIVFLNKRFCLTGPAASGKRKDLHKTIEDLGGKTHKTAVIDLDYLIIGAQSSPAWIYSTYGRKIEAVMQRKTNTPKCNTQIISEIDFINAMNKELAGRP